MSLAQEKASLDLLSQMEGDIQSLQGALQQESETKVTTVLDAGDLPLPSFTPEQKRQIRKYTHTGLTVLDEIEAQILKRFLYSGFYLVHVPGQ